MDTDKSPVSWRFERMRPSYAFDFKLYGQSIAAEVEEEDRNGRC